MSWGRIGVLAAAVAAAGAAFAAEPPASWDRFPDEDQVRLRDHWEITLSPEGTTTVVHEQEIQALTDAGREELQSLDFEMNRAIEEFSVERACTVHLDGSERCTPADDVLFEPEEDGEIVPGVVEPYDVIVPLLDVRVGSRVQVTTRRVVHLGPDRRLDRAIRVARRTGPTEGVTVVVRSGVSRPVYGRARGEAEYTVGEEDGQRVQRWRFGPHERLPTDQDRPRTADLSPMLYLSEFEDWAGFVTYYHPLAEAARQRFRGAPLRELEGLGEPRLERLDPVIRYGTLLDDRVPVYSVALSPVTLVPGEMDSVVARAGTEVEKAVALWTALGEAGVDAHLALATRNVLDQPFEFPCVSMLQDVGVWVEGRGFVRADGHADWVDTVPSVLRGGAVVVLDPDAPRVVSGAELDPPEDRPGWHRTGRLTISAGELRVHERLTFSGSAETAARSYWRELQDDLEDEEQTDRYVRRLYAAHLTRYPEDETSHVELATRAFLNERGYVDGRVREARLFDPWLPDEPPEVRTRYVADEAVEELGSLLLVHLPWNSESVSRRCLHDRPDRDAPLRVTCWTLEYRYELVVPGGYEVFGLPEDQRIETEWGTWSLQFHEQLLVEASAQGEGGADGLSAPRMSDGVPEDQRTVPGVVAIARYQILHNRVPVEGYASFLDLAGRHVLSIGDPVVLRRVSATR